MDYDNKHNTDYNIDDVILAIFNVQSTTAPDSNPSFTVPNYNPSFTARNYNPSAITEY